MQALPARAYRTLAEGAEPHRRIPTRLVPDPAEALVTPFLHLVLGCPRSSSS
jgi:hypothetical protein